MNKVIVMLVYNKIQYDSRVIRAAECLADAGYIIKVISCNSDINFKNDKFESIVVYSKLKGQMLLFYFWLSCLFYLLRNKKIIDLVYIHDYYLPIIGGIWYKLTKLPWIYDAHELLFFRRDEKVSLRTKFFFFLEKKNISSASLVVTANAERCRIMKTIYKIHDVIFVLNVSNIVDTKCIVCNKKNIIVYQGVMSSERDIDFFINGQCFLKSKFYLKLIGGGPYLLDLMNKVKMLGLQSSIIFTGRLNQYDLYQESCSARIGIITYPLTDLNNYYCSPNKIFEYAKMKIPMIVSTQPFLVSMIDKYHMGEVLDIRKGENEYVRLVEKITNNYDYYIEKMDEFLEDYAAVKEMKKLEIGVKRVI